MPLRDVSYHSSVLPLYQRLLSHHSSVQLIKLADDTTVEQLIEDSDKSSYRQEVDRLVSWCGNNNLDLNTSKTKEMIIDFRKENRL